MFFDLDLPPRFKLAEVAELVDLPDGRQARTTQNRMQIKMFFVYAIKSLVANYIYVGLTDSIERRIKQHNERRVRATKPYRPFKLIHVEEFSTRADARKREVFLKSGVGKEFLRSLD